VSPNGDTVVEAHFTLTDDQDEPDEQREEEEEEVRYPWQPPEVDGGFCRAVLGKNDDLRLKSR